MEFVGGFDSYSALLEDARAYEDVLDYMHGRAYAQQLAAGRAKAGW